MTVLNFTKCEFSLLVKYSPHYIKEGCVKKNSPERSKIGMIVEKRFYMSEDNKRAICFPSVRWEGEVTDYACHPANIVPYRKNVKLPTIES